MSDQHVALDPSSANLTTSDISDQLNRRVTMWPSKPTEPMPPTTRDDLRAYAEELKTLTAQNPEKHFADLFRARAMVLTELSRREEEESRQIHQHVMQDELWGHVTNFVTEFLRGYGAAAMSIAELRQKTKKR